MRGHERTWFSNIIYNAPPECVVLHNLCFVNKKGIGEDWIVQVKNKLNRKIGEGEIREGNELRGERAVIAQVKRRMLGTNDTPIANEVNDEEIKKN